MDESKSKFIYIQIVISILTLLLTPIFSALLTSYQLSRSQDYWIQQQGLLRSQEVYKTKIDLFQKSTGLVNSFNDAINNHNVSVVSQR
jgi:hypothetical protein